MATDNNNDGLTRRVIIRRSRGTGFGRGASTRSESLRTEDYDEADDIIDRQTDPEVVRDRILTNAARSPAIAPPNEVLPPRGAPAPSDRMHQVSQAGSASYSKEYRLTLLHRLLIRRVPLDQIAAQMGVSVSTIEKDRIELKSRLRQVARELDINEIVGDQTEVYNELSGMALRIASNEEVSAPMRLAAMRTSLAANADRTRFLNTAGVFDALRFRRAEDGADVSDVQRLMDRTNEMLTRVLEASDPEPAPAPKSRRTRPAGFAPFSLDDADASNSSDENVEL